MYPEYILKKLRLRQGLEHDDTSLDDRLNGLSPEVAFNEACMWEGFLGYGSSILGWVEDIYGIDIQQCADDAKKRKNSTNT